MAYVEKKDFFPKDLRKKYKLGEYADESTAKKTNTKKAATKKTTKK